MEEKPKTTNKNNEPHGSNKKDQSENFLSLQNKLEELNRELSNEKNRHLRTRADFDNYRKRVERDAEANRTLIKKEILLDLIKFLDYFDHARKQVKDPAALSGLEIMSRQFNELLHRHGVQPLECLGRPFDPEEHEGLGFIESEEIPEGCVAEEVCCGYRLGNTLLKPARVMVVRN